MYQMVHSGAQLLLNFKGITRKWTHLTADMDSREIRLDILSDRVRTAISVYLRNVAYNSIVRSRYKVDSLVLAS